MTDERSEILALAHMLDEAMGCDPLAGYFGGDADRQRFRVTGAVLGCLGAARNRIGYVVSEDLPGDPWEAVIESEGLLTLRGLEEWHAAHVGDPDGKGVPYYFMVEDADTGSEHVWYSDDALPIEVSDPDGQASAAAAGVRKGLDPAQLDFRPEDPGRIERKSERTGWGWRVYYERKEFRFALYWYDDDPSTLYLANVDVWPEYRGTGLGNELLDIAEEEARSFGAGELRLWCVRDGWVHGWYGRNGFEDFAADSEDPDRVWMKKPMR